MERTFGEEIAQLELGAGRELERERLWQAHPHSPVESLAVASHARLGECGELFREPRDKLLERRRDDDLSGAASFAAIGNTYFAMAVVPRGNDEARCRLYAEDRIAAVRKAFMDMAHNPKFKEDAVKAKLEVEPTSYETVDRLVQLISTTPPEVAKRLSDAMAPK